MSLTSFIWLAVCLLLWITLLVILRRAKLQAWYILAGMIGFFIIGMVFIRPLVTEPLARCVAALAGLFGRLTGFFTPYFKYALLFIESKNGSITMQIDFECSGVIEILVYLAIILFFRVCSPAERTLLAVGGTLYIILANTIRIIIICTIIHFGGSSWYYAAHTYIGRIFFYLATIWLYFYAITKPQIARMKTGSFSYSDQKTGEQK